MRRLLLAAGWIMANESKKPRGQRGHTLTDHQFGDAMDHEHGPDADHDHDHFEGIGPLEENPIWIQDNVVLTSVGMDIGSSGTQVIFSRVHMRRLGEDLTSRYIVAKRETLHESPVSLTPYRSDTRIDEVALGTIIDQAYGTAGLMPRDIDTGVVILTGEALRRENAERIAAILAEQGGEFVCATAGHHMEAMLAAYGSGAVRTSHDRQQRILNVDIGGGTTKLAIIDTGTVQATAAIHIGGRLQVTDAAGKITRLDPAGRHHASVAGFDWKLGDQAEPAHLDLVATEMAATLMTALRSPPLPEAVRRLYLTDPIEDFGRIDGIIVSGGVGEYVYGREDRDFGDMGKRLGHAVRTALGALPWPLLPAGACIRATALGASEYTIQLSGNTGHITSPGRLLPRRNVQVLHPIVPLGERVDPSALGDAIRAHFTAFDLDGSDADVAVALRWTGHPEYSRLRGFAEGVRHGLADRIAWGLPLYLMLDGDIAMTLGNILSKELGITNDLLVIDGVQLRDFDYIDLGKIRLPSGTVPVTIKSLLFQEQAGDSPRPRQRIHHHCHDHSHDHDHDHHHDHDHGHDHGHHHHHRG
jgi:ethanolamine utilization protein EutA (predicted chaperonin)